MFVSCHRPPTLAFPPRHRRKVNRTPGLGQGASHSACARAPLSVPDPFCLLRGNGFRKSDTVRSRWCATGCYGLTFPRHAGLQSSEALLETLTVTCAFSTRRLESHRVSRETRPIRRFRENERNIPARLAEVPPGDRDRRHRDRVCTHSSNQPQQFRDRSAALPPFGS